VFPRGKDRVSEIASDEYPFRDPASGNSNSVSYARNITAKKPYAWRENEITGCGGRLMPEL